MWLLTRSPPGGAPQVKGGDKGWSHQAVWADADDWFERRQADEQLSELENAERLKAQAAENARHTAQVLGTDGAQEAADAAAE